MSTPETPKLLVRLREFSIPAVRELKDLAAEFDPLFWQSPATDGPVFVGRGETLRLTFSGLARLTEAGNAWRELAAGATLTPDSALLPGCSATQTLASALTAFGSFSFAADSATESILIVPRFLLRHDGYLVEVWDAAAPAPAVHEFATAVANAHSPNDSGANKAQSAATVSSAPGFGPLRAASAPDARDFTAAVEHGLERIARGEAEKIVLARRITGKVAKNTDLRGPLSVLLREYGVGSAVFAVAGLLGASPEPLVRFAAGRLTSRVLAGTRKLGKKHREPAALARVTSELLADPKELREHEFARDSAVAALTECTSELRVNDTPRVLTLPNVVHLMSEITALVAPGRTSLDLVAALHPTAAVAGTPTAAALRLIHELEGFDRERFAGPVGWVNAAGDGEWAIALRCAQVGDIRTAENGAEMRSLTAWAGCGIVAGAVPAHELRETTAKLQPVRDAFGTAE